MLVDDLAFWLVAVPAILGVGIGKGGFGGGLGLLGVPIMSLAIAPTQAAAIMLPVLFLMDLVGIVTYRGSWDRRNMRIIIPGALVGIALGTATFAVTNDDVVRLLVGVIALGFAGNHYFGERLLGARSEPAQPSVIAGGAWSAIAGFVSFVAHAGGPPLNVYLLPQRLDKTIFVGTTVIFFAVVNAVKLVPYTALGQFDHTNLVASAALAPLAPVGFGLGVWLHHRVDEVLFYRLVYATLVITGAKLILDGAHIL